MKKNLLAAFAVLLVLCFASTMYAQGGTAIDIAQYRFLQKARHIGEYINKNAYADLEKEFDPSLQKQLPLEKLTPLLNSLIDGAGKIKNIGIPKIKWKNVAVTPVEFDSGLLDLRIDLDSTTDKIIGFYFQPHVEDLPVPDKNSTPLSLPFEGEWAVMWGGDTKELNPHHDQKPQRFAIDFNLLQAFDKSHKTNGKTNEDYFAFGKEILSPADGKVVEVIDGVHDNKPFSPNQFSALGNCVVIRHSSTEFSVLAHLQNGSTKVKVGESVSRGQAIGLCGNSGNSSEPELEYHLQNTGNIEDATGIKVYFDKVTTRHRDDLKKEKNYSPLRNDKLKED